MEKYCINCNKFLSLDNFRKRKNKEKYYYSSYCIICEKIKMRENSKKYYKNNKEKILKYKKEYKKTHKYEYKYNKNKLKRDYEYKKKRRKIDYLYRLSEQCRMVIYNSFKRNNHTKNDKTEEIVGCNNKFLIDYLLETFKNNYGYEWNGIEKIHIDHIIPLSTARTEEEVIKLCHYTNLQLLKAKDNLLKSNKIDFNIKEVNICMQKQTGKMLPVQIHQ